MFHMFNGCNNYIGGLKIQNGILDDVTNNSDVIKL